MKKVFGTAGRCGVGDFMEDLAAELRLLLCARSPRRGVESGDDPVFRIILPLDTASVGRVVRNMM